MVNLQPPPIDRTSERWPGWWRDFWTRVGKQPIGGTEGKIIQVDENGDFKESTLSVGSDFLVIGDPEVDGSWRLFISSSNLLVQRRESGTWVEKGAFLASL